MYQKVLKLLNQIYNAINYKFSIVEIFDRKLRNHKIKISYNEIKKIILIGENISVDGLIKITEPRGLILGSNIHFMDNINLDTMGGIFIGDNTYISENVNIFSSIPNYEGSLLPFDNRLIIKPVYIGRNVWIERNVNISPGVKIGNGAIIKMGSTVEKNIPSLSIVSGNPAKVIGKRNEHNYYLLDKKNADEGIKPKNKIISLAPINETHRKIVFVVGTGRSGSHAIVNFLNQNDEIEAYHEPNWRLLALSTEKETSLKSSEEITEELKFIYNNHSIIKPGKIYVESDQKLSNLIGELNLILPDSKFIWMIRKPDKFIRSAVARGWFTEPSYTSFDRASVLDKGYRTYCLRITADVINNNEFGDWSDMDQIDRCAWYWFYWNKTVSKQLKQIDRERWLIMDIESIKNRKAELSEFLELNLMQHSFEKTNVVKRKDIKEYNQMNLMNQISKRDSVKECQRLYNKVMI